MPFVDPCSQEPAIYPAIVVITFATNLLNSTVCIFQLGYLLLMTLGVADEFTHFNSEFKNNIQVHSRMKSSFEDDFEEWRLRHLELVEIAECVDNGFGLYIVLVFATNIPVCSFLVYRIIWTMAICSDEANFLPVLGQLTIHITLSVGILLVITYVGTRLNIEVCASRHCYLL